MASTIPLVRLDAPSGRGGERSFAFSGFERAIEARRPDEVWSALREAEAAVASGRHAAGFVAYEAAAGIDPLLATYPPAELPLVWLGIFAERRETHACHGEASDAAGSARVWRPDLTRAEYEATIGRIRERIGAGDTYQVNFTFRMKSDWEGQDVAAAYRALCLAQRASYCAMIDTGRFCVLSASPELFFRLRDRLVTTRPMKGTHRRGRFIEEDDRFAAALADSAKERAENLMIVDLLRNDLGRLAEPGSVRVRDLFTVERYETVLQMTTTVEARLRRGAGLTELFAALFPSGSVTGAPKVSTMKIIRELETSPRGVYTGAVGYLSPGPEATWSVAIRTLCIDRSRARATFGVGGGITWDSCASEEYEECLTKARVLETRRPSFELFETMRVDPAAGIRRRDRHLRRLEGSARYFGFAFDRGRLLEMLRTAEREAEETLRLRLVLARSGAATTEATPLDAEATGPLTAALCDLPVDSADPFLYHKTTHRTIYERRAARRPDVDQVILRNERGELTECPIGNLVVERGGRRYTPPLGCGLLPGTFREELLKSGELAERVLMPDDLQAADRVFLVNSVREWVPLVLRL
jgi:para-aminobenzoate synthetase/4-amino-4-deoxychorismate lyase